MKVITFAWGSIYEFSGEARIQMYVKLHDILQNEQQDIYISNEELE